LTLEVPAGRTHASSLPRPCNISMNVVYIGLEVWDSTLERKPYGRIDCLIIGTWVAHTLDHACVSTLFSLYWFVF
jgi:hypothetical protein